MVKLSLGEPLIQCMAKLADGNPGAAVALGSVAEKTVEVDPQIGLGPFHYIYVLDDMGLTGPQIHLLFKDVCKADAVKVIALLRSQQLGFTPTVDIVSAINTARPGPSYPTFDFPDVIQRIRTVVPDFAQEKT